jgi:hypothetical protein
MREAMIKSTNWPTLLLAFHFVCCAAVRAPAQEGYEEGEPSQWVEAEWYGGPNTELLPTSSGQPTSLAEYMGLGHGPILGHGDAYCAAASEPGIGSEWLDYAPFEIERAKPMNSLRVRLDSAWGYDSPDRSEFFWGKIGARGPAAAESGVAYQDFRFRIEQGTKKFSVATDIPIRVLDPEQNANTAGLGDMSLTTKTVLFEGQQWLITQIFKSHFNTGSPRHGLGTGHVSLEPGLLFRYKWSDVTYVNSDLTYWFPLGGDPDHSGQVIRYGLGFSHIYYDSDAFAVIPTLEFVSWWVLDGQQTTSAGATPAVDGQGILNVYPGVRFVFDSSRDCGVWDFGIAGGVAMTNDHWYQGLLRADVRWKW